MWRARCPSLANRNGYCLLVIGLVWLSVIGLCHSEDVCASACTCRDVIMTCVTPDTLGTFPLPVSEGFLNNVTEILVENQPRLDVVSAAYLRKFPGLVKLTIRKSGISKVEQDAFKYNGRLRSLHLESNQIAVITWKTLDGVMLRSLSLSDNPLMCDCGLKWLQDRTRQLPSLISDDPPISCLDPTTRSDHQIKNNDFTKCELPVITITPNVTTYVDVGDDVDVICSSLTSSATVLWIIDVMSSRHVIDSSTPDRVTLVLRNVTGEDSGVFSCLGENSVGRTEEKWTLIVNSAPRIINLEQPYEAFHWVIEYEVSGLPSPTISWLHNDQPLDLRDKNNVKDIRIAGGNRLGRIKGRLTFEMTHQVYNGRYTLIANNSYGSYNRTVNALFLEGPGDSVPVESSYPGFSFPDPAPTADSTSASAQASLQPTAASIEQTFDVRTIVIPIVCLIVLLLILLICAVKCCPKCCRKRNNRPISKQDEGVVGSDGCLCFGARRSSPSKRYRSGGEAVPLHSCTMVENPTYMKSLQSPDISISEGIRRIPRERIRLLRELGEGNFGRVYLGLCDLGSLPTLTFNDPEIMEGVGEACGGLTPVAVKTLKENHSESYRRDFEREAQLLTSLNHENIITFYGVSEDDLDTPMIVLEYMENGDLNNYLRSNGPDYEVFGKSSQTTKDKSSILSVVDLLVISHQVASGVYYLATQHFVHRDLATRNCLVGDRLKIKIGDFGMSRDIYSTDYYKVGGQAMLPIRWMPAESIIYSTFSVESDLWSFGVVLWEIFSYGRQPWYELSNKEVMDQVELGRSLERPRDCPREVYDVMVGCWRRVPHDRTNIKQILNRLHELVKQYSASAALPAAGTRAEVRQEAAGTVAAAPSAAAAGHNPAAASGGTASEVAATEIGTGRNVLESQYLEMI